MTPPAPFKATIVVNYPCEGQSFDEEDDLLAQRLARDRLLLREFSSMCHYGNLAGAPPPTAFTERHCALGGAWECDLGGCYTIHVPRIHRDELTCAFGVPSPNETEIKGGLRPWEGKDE